MARPIRMPTPGQMTEECTVLQWFKHEGDTVAKGDALFEIETDKSNMEIESFEEGTLLRIDAQVGATVPVDAVIAWIGEAGEAIPEGKEVASAADSAPAPVAEEAPAVAEQEQPEAASPAVEETAAAASENPSSAAAASAAAPSRMAISPRASRIAAELGVDPRSLTGSGPGGRIVERDVRGAANASAPTLQLEDAMPSAVPAAAAPVAAATDAASPPTGAAAPSSQAPAASTAAAPPTRTAATPPGATSSSPEGGADGVKLSRIRQVIARRLTESVTTIPHFDVTIAVDMTGLMELRAKLKAQGSPVTVTDFIHAATVQALVELPTVNARTDGKTLWKRTAVHLGIAVSIPDGLLEPVVRDAQDLSVSGLHDRTAVLIEGARSGSLGVDCVSLFRLACVVVRAEWLWPSAAARVLWPRVKLPRTGA